MQVRYTPLVLWLLTTALATCPPETPSLDNALTASEKAFANLDDAIDKRRKELETAVGCLEQPITVEQAALMHRTMALFHFLDRHDPEAVASFARYRRLAKSPSLSASLAPERHPLRLLYEKATPTSALRELPKPDGGRLLVDGGGALAAEREPFVVQHIRNGSVVRTDVVEAGGRLPNYLRDRATIETISLTPKQRNMVLTGAGIGLVGAGLYAGAFLSRNGYDKAIEQRDRDKAKSTHTRTNALTISGLGLFGVGAGLTIAGIL